MKVLALASYPKEAACTRYRVEQFIRPLAERGITMTVRPFIDSALFDSLYRQQSWLRTGAGLSKSALFRLGDLIAATSADVIFKCRYCCRALGAPDQRFIRDGVDDDRLLHKSVEELAAVATPAPIEPKGEAICGLA